MTIQRANDRLWSCLSSDPKPDHFAQGILLIETDTGVWWITQEDGAWKACYPTLAQHQEMEARVTQAEAEHQALHDVVTALAPELGALRTIIADIQRGR